MTGDVVYRVLRNNSAFSAIAADRIYPNVIPDGATFPCAAYSVDSITRHSSHDEVGGLSQGRVSVDCWATTYPSAKALASAVRVAVGGYTGSASTSQVVQAVFVEDQRCDYVADDVEARRYYVHSVDFTIWHKEPNT